MSSILEGFPNCETVFTQLYLRSCIVLQALHSSNALGNIQHSLFTDGGLSIRPTADSMVRQHLSCQLQMC